MQADNEIDLALERILDNEDPFEDTDTRNSGAALSSGLKPCPASQRKTLLLLLQTSLRGLVASTPKSPQPVTKPKDPSQMQDELLSATFDVSDIDDEFMAALAAAEDGGCPRNNNQATSTPVKSPQGIRRRRSTQSLETLQNKKTCTYIQTTSQTAAPLMQESDTGVDIVKPSEAGPVPAQVSEPPQVLTSSQVRNPFTVPTQFQRLYSTATPQELKHHTLLLATQHMPKQLKQKGLSLEKPPENRSSKSVKPIILSKEQEYILKRVMHGVSLFYTGSAGTGKSVLLRSIIKSLREKYDRGIAVTASTGLAACNIGGITLHSFAGIGLGQGTVESLLRKVRRNRTALRRWQETRVLIIDEISMVDGNLLDKLNELAKRIRHNTSPFGGIQLVACGDFYQLPPVVKNMDPNEKKVEPYFSFECKAWEEAIKQTLTLKEIFRQKGDQPFIDMLNEIRDGRISLGTINKFRSLERRLKCPEGFVPSELYATRNEVERANNRKLNSMEGEIVTYTARDGGTLEKKRIEMLVSNFLAPKKLQLKIGAQVMCIKNYDERLVNGSLGKVVAFVDGVTYFKKGKGDKEENKKDADDFVFGEFKRDQLVSTKDLAGANPPSENQRKSKLEARILGDQGYGKLPVVKFLHTDGSMRTVVVEPETTTIEDDDGKVLASRTQFPLMLAWSLLIHKAQGQSLQYAVVDMKKVFERGQAYVALSRAVSRSGLQVKNFKADKIVAHPKVIKFYKSLYSYEQDVKE
ncbi:ATP-dependent DNA helicase PIF1 [Candida viswanathii]|uniref:ATP-dependent DNA helicase PIF1 n=1 Tax=Candida viswanathii TaxID=5486 RepID=A0A367YDY7_9ASCO|nr:ATP-dependent DNA helicase PIF1 [Candida viswanathii]